MFGDISVVFYWCVPPYGGGQWAGHRAHPNFGFLSSLPPLLSFGCVCPLCVLVEGETLLHRACKRNQVETVLQILAIPGTDVNIKGKTFSLSFFSLNLSLVISLHSHCLVWGFEERLALERKNRREEIGVRVRHH